MLTKQLGLAGRRSSAPTCARPALPYKVTFVATYHCNFRCEMCNIWQKKSVDEMTPDEVGQFFDRWPQFRWVHLTGGELFMRRDLDDLVAAIQGSCRSLFLLNFPTTGWFGDKTIDAGRAHAEARRRPADGDHQHRRPEGAARGDARAAGQLGRAIETFRRLRGIKRSNFQTVIGMTLMAKNATKVDETIAAIRQVIPDFTPERAAPEHRPRVGALLRQRRLPVERRRITRRSCEAVERPSPGERHVAASRCSSSRIAIRR